MSLSISYRSRVSSIDWLRGLIMMIMALDHCREYLHANAFFSNPLDLEHPSYLLFFTRWVTHFCAPNFVFLAGISAYLSGLKKTTRQHRWFLFTRGLWLIFLELTVITFGLWFDIHFSFITLQVIWAIGISLLLLSALLGLPSYAILLLGVLIIAGHNLLDTIAPTEGSLLWISHQPGSLPIGSGRFLLNLYPFLAWTGILLTGYGVGALFRPQVSSAERKQWLASLGLGALLLFLIIRWINHYGDPSPWQSYSSFGITFLSFINTSKYPPSLLYTLMTLGPTLLALSLLEGRNTGYFSWIEVYGKVPLFYYVLHFYLIHGLSVLLHLYQGISWENLNFQNGSAGVTPHVGLPIWRVYLVWLTVLAFLYPLCKAYGAFKKRQRHRLWSYL
ncbi:heparan-alpha-glucosaminide N-acetyltransferase domain-containing protein [Siphonobacter sp. SORGH_AS_0500]|uniref:DUF1624 domain-containing protein n=1 Tax=Siphonobacter sp. SORGH_AS_0500 TaxID=1864824 RepID=UPI0028606C71|nr:heparan-alpha-glucosaminide N-acetyltransferase domain-containing protein [Siphonobacter sp. SORGH_AS_0500]MDR6196714.1 putative membrane protein [Siphonobacter sp. SORGH_AS_0500]